MDVKTVGIANKIIEIYNYYYHTKLRKRLKNNEFSIISDTCVGGIIYHRLGLQFSSPTINLGIGEDVDSFIDFVENLYDYSKSRLIFQHDCPRYPTAVLNPGGGIYSFYTLQD